MQDDEPIAVAIWQRPQQDAVHDAEDGGVGADAERHRDDDHEREAAIAPEAAEAVANVLDGNLDEPRQPAVAHVVLDAGDRAEHAQGLAARLGGRHARLHVLLGQHVDVIAELLIELTLEPFATEERAQPHREPFGSHG